MRARTVLIASTLLLNIFLVDKTKGSENVTLEPMISLSTSAQQVRVLLEDGLRWLDEGQVDRANQHFHEAASIAPNDPMPLLALAKSALKEGDKASAFRSINRAKSIASNSLEVLISQARLFQQINQNGQSERLYKNALKLTEEPWTIETELGYLYLNAYDRPQDALASFDKAIQAAPNYNTAHYGRGLSLVKLGLYDKAIAAYQQVALNNPNDSHIFKTLGRLRMKMEQPTEAISAFNDGLNIEPENFELLMDRGEAFKTLGNIDAAIKDFSAASAAKPNIHIPALRLAMLAHENKQFSNAQKYYEKVLALEPNHIITLNNLAWLFAETDTNLDRGIQLSRKALSLTKQSPLLLDTLAWLYRAKGDLSLAEQILVRAVSAQSSPRATTYYYLGVVKQELDKPLEAASAFNLAISIEPDFIYAEETQMRLNELEGKN